MNNERSDVNSVEFYRDQVARIVPATGKIYDITHADTAEHSVSLPAGYPANTKAIQIKAYRVAGTGNFQPQSLSGGSTERVPTLYGTLWFRSTDGLFYYTLSVANDVWEISALGYITA